MFLHATDLLKRAAQIYDENRGGLRSSALSIKCLDFSQGAIWMRQAMQTISPMNITAYEMPSFVLCNLYGLAKYGTAFLVAIILVSIMHFSGIFWPFLALAFVLAFYAAEAQTVFLFPLLLESAEHPFLDNRKLLAGAGGTVRVMSNVMLLAAVMLLGGFIGKGFTRSWCLGCLSIVLWYHDLKNS